MNKEFNLNHFTAATRSPFIAFFRGDSIFSDGGLDRLPLIYTWSISNVDKIGISLSSDQSNYSQNVELKLELSKLWKTGDAEKRAAIIKWVISDWGGIYGNSKSKLAEYFKRAQEPSISAPLAGIASYSKVLAAIDPNEFAIFDARVAVSLNAIQILGRSEQGIVFPYISGRNKITGDWSSKPKRGFSTIEKYKPKSLLKSHNNWIRINNGDVYKTYMKLLKAISADVARPVYELEMLLFASAEMLALKVEPNII